MAAVVGNRKDYELDIVLLSTKDGSVIRNLTPGFDKDRGFEYIAVPGSRWNSVPWMSWSPIGDRLAYFVRTEKQRTLLIQNVVTGKTEQRVRAQGPSTCRSRPTSRPTARRVVFSALQNAIGDIYKLDLASGEIINLTKDDFADYAPTYSPDGKYLVYMARISGNNKLFRLDLDTGKKTQLTFGTHDEAAASFIDPKTLAFASTAIDPAKPVSPEDARNGNIYNIWTLNLRDQRAAAVHRRAERQPLGRRAQRRRHEQDGVRDLLQDRIRRAHAGAEAADRDRGLGRLRRAGADHRLPAAALAHAREGQPAQQGHVREAVPRRPPADQRRRHQRRRPVRRIAGDVLATCSAISSSTCSSRRSRSTARCRCPTSICRGACSTRSQGFTQTTFFYGLADSVFFEAGLSPFLDRDHARRDADDPRRHASTASIR